MRRHDFCWNYLFNTLRPSHLGTVASRHCPPPPPVEICRGKQNASETISPTTVHHEHRYNLPNEAHRHYLTSPSSKSTSKCLEFILLLRTLSPQSNRQAIAPATRPDMTKTQRQNTVASPFIFCTSFIFCRISRDKYTSVFAHPLLPHQSTHPHPTPIPSHPSHLQPSP